MAIFVRFAYALYFINITSIPTKPPEYRRQIFEYGSQIINLKNLTLEYVGLSLVLSDLLYYSSFIFSYMSCFANRL